MAILDHCYSISLPSVLPPNHQMSQF